MNIAMAPHSVLRIDDARGVVVEVERGLLWLTEEGDPRDRYVGAGDWLRLDRDGVAIANALEPTILILSRVREPFFAQLQRILFQPLAETA